MRRVVVAVVLVALVAACGGDDDEPADATPASGAADAAEVCSRFEELVTEAQDGAVEGEELEQQLDALADAAYEADDQDLFNALADASTSLVEGQPGADAVAEVRTACG